MLLYTILHRIFKDIQMLTVTTNLRTLCDGVTTDSFQTISVNGFIVIL